MLQKKGKISIGILIMAVLMFLPVQNVEAAWWGLGRCDPLAWQPLGCCVDDCIIGQVKCMPSGERAYLCGDYDTIWDVDECYEYPPEGPLDNTKSCSYGCWAGIPATGDICQDEDPCAGIGCIAGQTRCGRKCPEGLSCLNPGDWVDSVQTCKIIAEGRFDCYGWGYDWSKQVECRYGCEAGACLTQDQRDCSTCVPGMTKCDTSGYYIIECVDKNKDGCHHWEQNQIDWYPCPYGCAEDYSIDGMAYCKDDEGEIICDKCTWGDTRCNPNDDYYLQYCLAKDIYGCSEWKTDYSDHVIAGRTNWHITYGQYCPFGCHIGSCRPDPDPDVIVEDACVEGQTRCGGDGSYEVVCQYDGTNWIWGNSHKCTSGLCMSGECVTVTSRGYEFKLRFPSWYQDDTWYYNSLDTDGTNFYIKTWSPHGILTVDMNGTYVSNCSMLDGALEVGSSSRGMTLNEKIFYVVGPNKDNLLRFDRNCNNLTNFTLDTAIDSIFRLTSNGTNIFINNIGSTTGIGVFDITSATVGNHSYNICLVVVELGYTACVSNNFDLTYDDDRLYVLYVDSTIYNGQYDEEGNPLLQTYGTDGYYYAEGSTQWNKTLGIDIESPDGYNPSNLEGIAAHDGKLYLLWARDSGREALISVFYLDRTCQSTCNEGGSHCVGLNKEYVSKCIQTPDGCWKYFDEVGHLFPAGTDDDYMENCGNTQCKETWLNHYILTATCDDDISCEDVCDAGEWGCETPQEGVYPHTGSKYKVKCILKSSPVPFNLGRECYGWANPYDRLENESNYEFCGMSYSCIDGECVKVGDQCSLNESKCSEDNKYVIPCWTIQNVNQWSWGNRTFCEWGCNESFNSTTNKRFGECRVGTQTDVTTSGMKSAFIEIETWWNELWFDPLRQLFITLILMVAAFVVLRNGGWQIAAGGSLMILIGSLATGWMGTIILFGILIVVGIVVLPKYLGRIR